MAKPELLAYFILDANGNPKSIKAGGFRHYKIRLSTINTPKDTYAVTYVLDESYYDPILESKNKINDFEEEITSYGDYSIVAKVRTTGNTILVSDSLFRALKKGHNSSLSRPVMDALDEIKEN